MGFNHFLSCESFINQLSELLSSEQATIITHNILQVHRTSNFRDLLQRTLDRAIAYEIISSSLGTDLYDKERQKCDSSDRSIVHRNFNLAHIALASKEKSTNEL